MDDIWKTNGGVYFGFGSAKTEGPPPPLSASTAIRYKGDRHLVTIGPNGSGKSRRLLVPNLAELTGWSIVVVDPKGDLAKMTGDHRERKGSHVIRLNPFDVLNLKSDGFNPIAALDPQSEDFPDDAMGLAEALIRVEGRDPHWSASAQEIVCALIMYVRVTLGPTASLNDVRKMLGKSSKEFRDIVLARSIDYEGKPIPGMLPASVIFHCPELETKASRFADIGPENREIASVMSVALTQTRWLDSRPVANEVGGEPFDFSRLKREPTTVYLMLPARRLGTHSTWLRLMITSILQPLMKDTQEAKVPVLLMLDEFAQLGHLPVIEQTVALMRGFGIKLWAVFQDLTQAKAIYDKRWESFLGNAGVVQSFAPQDVETADYLSERTGQATASATSATNAHGADVALGVNQIPIPLMLPQDLRQMDDGYSVMFSHKAKGTVRAYFPYPADLPHLREICALDPSYKGR
jgi:type IV secretion system protein VirD4